MGFAMTDDSMKCCNVSLDSGADHALPGFAVPQIPVLYAINKTWKVPQIHDGAPSKPPRFMRD